MDAVNTKIYNVANLFNIMEPLLSERIIRSNLSTMFAAISLQPQGK